MVGCRTAAFVALSQVSKLLLTRDVTQATHAGQRAPYLVCVTLSSKTGLNTARLPELR